MEEKAKELSLRMLLSLFLSNSILIERLRAVEMKARMIMSLRFSVAFVFKRKITIFRDISEHELMEQI